MPSPPIARPPGIAARTRHVDMPGRAARLKIDADHPTRPATDAQAVAAIGGDVNGARQLRAPAGRSRRRAPPIRYAIWVGTKKRSLRSNKETALATGPFTELPGHNWTQLGSPDAS